MPSKNSLKVSFVTSGTQKIRGFSVFAHIKLFKENQCNNATYIFIISRDFKTLPSAVQCSA